MTIIESPQQAAMQLAKGKLAIGFKPEAIHTYTDREGNALFWRIRLKHEETSEKWIRPMKRDGKGYALGEPSFPQGKPLYRLHELGSRPDEPVFLVEGEWCADALTRIGVLTTTSGSADSASKADWEPLRGRIVTIWPDYDKPGKRYANEAAEHLSALDCVVRIIDVESLGLPHKGDVVDWLKDHQKAKAADIHALPILTLSEGLQDASSAKTMPAYTQQCEASKTDEKVILELAELSPLDYDRIRESKAEEMGIRVSTLDKMVSKAQKSENSEGLGLDDVQPWPKPIEPSQLLTDIARTVRRFIVCQDETAQAAALWVAMTWFIDVVQVAPLAVITAPEKRCGKSQLLFLLGKMVHRPLAASNITPAALFRAVDAWKPTLLVDKADAFMRDNDELRGLLNCGHTRESAYIVRVVGENHVPTMFNVWGAKAIAGIGRLADTLMDRAITLELRRKLPHESVERLRHAEVGLFDSIAAKLARFAEDYADAIQQALPDLPESLNDRAQDNWEPLLAIADVAGGLWPDLARAAALKLSGGESQSMTPGTELLADIQEIFDNKHVVKIRTEELIKALCEDNEKPWATYNRGNSITPRQVANRLKEYGIHSKTIRFGSTTAKGYARPCFEDAFARYLQSPSVTTSQPKDNTKSGVTYNNTVTVTQTPSVTLNPELDKDCYAVTDGKQNSIDQRGEFA